MMEAVAFTNKLQSLNDLQQKLVGQRSALLKRQSQKTEELQVAREASLEIQKTKIALDALIQQFIGFQLDKISEYVTYGLRTVIADQDLKFVCKITTKNNKPWVELLTVNAEGVEAEALDGYGGSVAQIESLILRVLAVMQLKLYPFIALDESLNAVSDEYLPNLSKLLSEIHKQLRIKILLVTHNKDVLTHADRIYRAKESGNGLVLEEIKHSDV